jgi:hypothetical protein
MYKPYIVGNREPGSYTPKRSRIADKRESTETNNKIYVLNKSLKDEIVNYAHNVSYGVTNLRSTAKQTSNDMENFNRNVHREGFNTAQEWLSGDLEEFAENYNKSSGFMQSQQQSPALRTFSYEIADNLYYNRDRLSMVGLNVGEEGRLSFDREYFQSMPQEKINVAIGENIQIFSGLQRHAGAFLSEPLVDHMRFKGLGYHYNYKMGAMETDGFGILETGMLIDKAV